MGLRDYGYKDIFSHREMVQNLINQPFTEDWFEEIEPTSLEKVNGHFISGRYRRRESDVVWRMRYKGKWLYLYLLLEFQSDVDRYMSVRLMSYIGLLYEDLIKSKGLSESGELPPVLPWVIYTGKTNWSAPLHSHLLLEKEVSSEMRNYFPHFKYHILDVGHHVWEEGFKQEENLVLLLIELEQTEFNWKLAEPIIARLENRLKGDEHSSLRQAFARYAFQVLKLKGKGKALPMEKIDLKEVKQMLAERIEAYESSLIQQGMERGIQQGMEAVAREMLKRGVDYQFVSEITHIPLVSLEKLETK